MTVLFQMVPVVLAVTLALTIALVFSRSVLELVFGALRRATGGAPPESSGD
ncbi:MAG: hypothetical protein ACE5HD_04085 [Acidobacteriota bacterium]